MRQYRQKLLGLAITTLTMKSSRGFHATSLAGRDAPISTRVFASSSGGNDEESSRSSAQMDRRRAMGAALMTFSTLIPASSNAFDRTFPDELADSDNGVKNVVMGGRLNLQQRTVVAKAKDRARKQKLINPLSKEDLLPSFTWAGALWLVSGSRSNPLTTPLGNLLYNEEESQWLKDRNAGLFSTPPVEFLVLLGFVFVVLGFITQFSLLQLTEGDATVCFELAGVTLIWGGFFEIGRVAIGEKGATREESDRGMQLKGEFDKFANARLEMTGNCHRTDVIAAFRRYYAKYRNKDSTEYPLDDMEIEKLLRAWNKNENRGQAEMTSSGFWYGVQINTDADIFVSKR
jgi:hypothetical protein